jgi:hypothetical protein
MTAQHKPGGELSIRITVTGPGGGVLVSNGSEGPALWPGRVLNVSSGGRSGGPYEVDVRVPAAVREVVVTTAAGDVVAIPLHDHQEFPDVRFGLVLTDPNLHLSHVAAYDEDGRQVDQFDLSFHQRVWHDQ